jgi:hypothetical protein
MNTKKRKAPKKTRFCKDCAHASRESRYKSLDMPTNSYACIRDARVDFTDHVTGVETISGVRECSFERSQCSHESYWPSFGKLCGAKGRFWKPKPKTKRDDYELDDDGFPQ